MTYVYIYTYNRISRTHWSHNFSINENINGSYLEIVQALFRHKTRGKSGLLAAATVIWCGCTPDRSLGPCYAACRWTRHMSCVPVDAVTRYTVAGRPSPLLFDDVSDGRSVRMPLWRVHAWMRRRLPMWWLKCSDLSMVTCQTHAKFTQKQAPGVWLA